MLGDMPSLDVRLFGIGIALTRSRHERCIDDLPRYRNITGLTQHGVKSGEQSADGSRLAQPFPKQPDRLGVGNPVREAQSQEAHERQSVVDGIIGAFIRQCIDRLYHQNFEHQNRVKRREATLCSVRIGQRLLQIGTELFKIYRAGKCLELVAETAQPRKPLLNDLDRLQQATLEKGGKAITVLPPTAGMVGYVF